MTTENNIFFLFLIVIAVFLKKIGRDGNEFAWTSGDLYFFFNREIVLTIH